MMRICMKVARPIVVAGPKSRSFAVSVRRSFATDSHKQGQDKSGGPGGLSGSGGLGGGASNASNLGGSSGSGASGKGNAPSSRPQNDGHAQNDSSRGQYDNSNSGSSSQSQSGNSSSRVDTSRIKEHAEVVGSDGGHVGTVDHLDGQRIKLTKKDSQAGGQHHYIQLESIASVEGGQVRLKHTAAQAKQEWESNSRNQNDNSSSHGQKDNSNSRNQYDSSSSSSGSRNQYDNSSSNSRNQSDNSSSSSNSHKSSDKATSGERQSSTGSQNSQMSGANYIKSDVKGASPASDSSKASGDKRNKL